MKKYTYLGITAATLLAIAPTIVTPTNIAHAADATQQSVPVQGQGNTTQDQNQAPVAQPRSVETFDDTQQGTDTIAPAGFWGNLASGIKNMATGAVNTAVHTATGFAEDQAKKGLQTVVQKFEDGGKQLASNVINSITGKNKKNPAKDDTNSTMSIDDALTSLSNVVYDDNNPMPDFSEFITLYKTPIHNDKFNQLGLVNYGFDPDAVATIGKALTDNKATIEFGGILDAQTLQNQINAAKQGKGKQFKISVTLTDASNKKHATNIIFKNNAGLNKVNNNNQQKKPNQTSNVSTDAADWQIIQSKGSVTVGNVSAELQDDSDLTTSRGLAPRSGWATNEYRINPKSGEIEYHVSTHEWVREKFLTVTQKSSNLATTAFSGETNFDGKQNVRLAGPAKYTYALFKADGSRSVRSIAGDTTWFTDKFATDDNGNTYYRVSTDEWIKLGEGVSLTN
ncbi:hypothetical protein [Companilactobacillus ginsenosidimutans]|uniref:Surface layer protein A domain-containing protein n=1 Tax=Companilactobacillus ginsenosidimutans TaxID=1007676 RepID=A0A0H4QJM9_9LACO|nr:hypothetical protein [Companilactobacillus ginsenosidimutans]AKP67246.1 hypothetical protein ABM34_06635 [Companilactobacillus ginsenosidimutans]